MTYESNLFRQLFGDVSQGRAVGTGMEQARQSDLAAQQALTQGRNLSNKMASAQLPGMRDRIGRQDRAQELLNRQRQMDLKRARQTQYRTIQGRDGHQYQVPVDQQGRMVGKPVKVEGLGEPRPDVISDSRGGQYQRKYNPQTGQYEVTPLRVEGEDQPFARKPSAAQGAVDKEFGKEYVEWKARGGYADVEKNLAQLEKVRAALQGVVDGTKDGNISGGGVGLTPDKMLAYTNPDALNMKEQVQEVVQRNLRLILGAQFTEKEGERLISRAYNDALDESVNLERVNRLIGQIKKAAMAKESAAAYYEQHGTLDGWRGELVTFEEIEQAAGPQVGDIEDGYRFKGGDPKDPNNWEKT